jgi:hypothetical protein
VAETLGTAELILTVNDKALREGLAEARRLIEGTTAEVGRRSRTTTSATRFNQPNPVSPGVSVRPNPAAIEAERQLAQERVKTAAATRKAAADELRAAQQRSKEIRKRAGGAISSGLIGGGFPLLFGQGPGAAVGGAFGGVAGGALGGGFGFALSIVGTAVGQAFDEALNKGKTLAAGLEDPIGKFSALQEAALLSSKGLEKNVEALINAGRQEEAIAAIRADLTANFGDVSAANTLNEALDNLQRSWTSLGIAVVSFTAGPLSDFIEKLNQGLRAGLELSQSERLDIQRRAEKAVTDNTNVFQRFDQLALSVPFEGKTFKGSATGIRDDIVNQLEKELLIKKQIERQEKATQQYTTETAGILARNNELVQIENDLIIANVNNYKKRSLELQKQKLDLQEIAELNSVPSNTPFAEKVATDKIKLDFAQRRLTVNEQLNNLEKDSLATQTLDTARNRLALESVQERISAARQLGSLEEGVARSTLETALNIRASVAEAKRREQEIGAQIDAARIRGGDAGEAEASRLVGEQRVAAQETKLRIIEGATALRDAGARLRQDAEDVSNRLQKLRENNRRFLTPDQRAQVDADLNREVQQEAIRRNIRITFTGTPDQIRAEKRAFLDFGKEESQYLKQGKAISDAITISTLPIIESNQALAASVGSLNQIIDALALKDWSVNVLVNSDGTSQVYGDAVNGALAT